MEIEMPLDLDTFAKNFGRTDYLKTGGCDSDFDGSGDIDFLDIGLFTTDISRTHCRKPIE